MRRSRLFAASTAVAAALAGGCGMEDTGSNALNPATDVDPVFFSFTLTEQTDTTLFHDLLLALEPAPYSEPEADTLAEAIRDQLALFLNLSYQPGPPLTLVSVRNPLDLMRRVIGENEIENFNEARRYISARIDEGVAGEYSNTTNDALVRFTDQGAIFEGRPITDYEWRYPIVKWVYTPDTSNRVTRVLTWVASGEFPEGSTRPSATLGTQFDPSGFQAIGYNDGARLHSEGSVVIEGEREMAFVRDYDGENTDAITIDGTAAGTAEGTAGPDFEFGGQTVDCLKVVMHYGEKRVDLYTSRDVDPDDEAYCTAQDSPTASYATADTGLRP
ncbi:hypothetical protein [Marinobacter lutaoensis]|uniref:hypothetical protein n=1 Tax=Marinobacter lutaoensis TaxID=135739 RepID=UPI0015937FDD|nr:hypothetical protein [Marinobacter lutaoensis]NVD34267.1 hypothetical protein [Marinobacter lutaoensis]